MIMYTQVNAITDYLMIILFFALVYLAFSWDGFINRLCNHSFCHFLGRFSIALYMSHEMAHNLPGLLYPAEWKRRHMTYIIAAVIFAAFDYLIAAALKQCIFRLNDKYKKKNGN